MASAKKAMGMDCSGHIRCQFLQITTNIIFQSSSIWNSQMMITYTVQEKLKGILPSKGLHSGSSLKLHISCFISDLRFPLHATKKTSGEAREGDWSSGTVHTKTVPHRQALRHYFGESRHHIYVVKFSTLKILTANFRIPWKYAFWYLQESIPISVGVWNVILHRGTEK